MPLALRTSDRIDDIGGRLTLAAHRSTTVTSCVIGIIIALAMGSTSAPADTTQATYSLTSSPGSTCTPAPHCAPGSSEQSFVDFFNYIMNIPDTILQQGDNATENWIKQHPRRGNPYGNASYSAFHMSRPDVSSPYRCTLAVSALLVTTALPALKIIKIKRYVESVGGVVEAARLVVGASSATEKAAEVLKALKGLIGELLGITAVSQFCFN